MFFEWLAGRHHCLEVIMCVVHWFSERKLCLSEIKKKKKILRKPKNQLPQVVAAGITTGILMFCTYSYC